SLYVWVLYTDASPRRPALLTPHACAQSSIRTTPLSSRPAAILSASVADMPRMWANTAAFVRGPTSGLSSSQASARSSPTGATTGQAPAAQTAAPTETQDSSGTITSSPG